MARMEECRENTEAHDTTLTEYIFAQKMEPYAIGLMIEIQ
jgi:hypothetical protein